jgi:hypothetical protein
MYSPRSSAELAARVRSLIGPGNRDRWREAADELGVPTGDLVEIVQHATPYPSVSALAAIVAYYGVDAGWLLTGEYSPALHRADEEAGQPAADRLTRFLRYEAESHLEENGEPAKLRLAQLLRDSPLPADLGKD